MISRAPSPSRPTICPKIEAKMREIVARDLPTRRTVWPRDKAIAHFEEIGEKYKAELIRGPAALRRDHHLLSRRLARSLPRAALRLHGENRPGLQADQDRRRLLARGTRRTPSSSASTAPPGATRRNWKPISSGWRKPRSATIASWARRWTSSTCRKRPWARCFWHPKGFALYHALEDYIRRKLDKSGYQEVKTPAPDRPQGSGSCPGIGRIIGRNMFVAEVEDEKKTLAVKPMNCPGHVQILQAGHQILSRACLCGWPSSAPAIATSRPARCTASCGCAPSPRTMRIFSARTNRSPARPSLSANC